MCSLIVINFPPTFKNLNPNNLLNDEIARNFAARFREEILARGYWAKKISLITHARHSFSPVWWNWRG